MLQYQQAEKLVQKAIQALPESLTLTYIAYDDHLTDKQVAMVLGGQIDEVIEEVEEYAVDNDDPYVNELLGETLPDPVERAIVQEDADAMATFHDTCRELDDSDPYPDLLKNTHRRMVRVMVGGLCEDHDYDIETIHGATLPSDSWRWDEAKTEVEAKKLAEAAKVDWATNRDAFIEIVENATYGGRLCVLYYADIQELAKAVEYLVKAHHDVPANDKARVRLTFTDPTLLVRDWINGSGHEHSVKGQVVVEFGYADLDSRHGVLQLDHTGACTGYSWSDDIAGVVYSYYENSPMLELLRF